MGTEDTLDDVLIIMDPYDTTDQDNDGYTIESYERLSSGLFTMDSEVSGTKFITAAPAEGWKYEQTIGDGINTDSVSYTHLDVYKRQVFNSFLI